MPQEQRMCELCHEGVEDELHYPFTCSTMNMRESGLLLDHGSQLCNTITSLQYNETLVFLLQIELSSASCKIPIKLQEN